MGGKPPRSNELASRAEPDDVIGMMAKRRQQEAERDPDELLADDSAAMARLLAGFGDVVEITTADGRRERRPGAEVAAALHRPLSAEELDDGLPPRSPEADALGLQWIGYHPQRGDRSDGGRALVAEACELLGPMGLWHALARLEEPEPAPQPTASLSAMIERYQIALEVVTDIAEQTRGTGVTSAGEAITLYEGDLASVGRRIHASLRTMTELRQSRQIEAERLSDVTTRGPDGREPKAARGERGHWSAGTRLRRYITAIAPLAEANWTWRQRAELVLLSGGWTHPPCRRFVGRLLGDADSDRAATVTRLADRLKQAASRA